MGLISRIKTWINLEEVTHTALNAEFNNIITKMTPDYVEDHSISLAEARTDLSPYQNGLLVKATTLAEEIEQLRYQIKSMTGETYWYEPVASSISSLVSILAVANHRRTSGRVNSFRMPAYLVPSGSAATVTLKGATTNFVATINDSVKTFVADTAETSLSAAPSSNNTTLVNNAAFSGQDYTKTLGECDSKIPIDAIGSEISALNGKLAGFKVVHSATTEYFIAEVDSSGGFLKNAYRGFFLDSTDAHIDRVALSDNDTITLMRLTYVFAVIDSGVEDVDVTYNQPVVAYTAPSSPSSGDYWFDLSTNLWKRYSGGNFTATDAIFAGLCIQDSSNCVGARSADWSRAYSNVDDLDLERSSATTVKCKFAASVVSSYGNTHRYEPNSPLWTITTDLDSGISEAASTTYYLYVTDLGGRVMTTVPPHDRSNDLKGFYHPGKPWRCVGSIFNDASQDFGLLVGSQKRRASATLPSVKNACLKASVAASALTITLTAADGSDPSPMNPVEANFQSGSITLPTRFRRAITQPLSLTVPSTATLGVVAGTNLISYVHVFIVNLARGPALAVSTFAQYSHPVLPYASVTAMSTGADFSSMYSESTESNVPYVYVGRIKCPQATPGTWATAPTNIYMGLTPIMHGRGSTISGNGATNNGAVATKVRRLDAANDGLTVSWDTDFVVASDANSGTTITIYTSGVYYLEATDAYSGGSIGFGISVHSSAVTTKFASLAANEQATSPISSPGAGLLGKSSGIRVLSAGDVLRLHGEGTGDSSLVQVKINKLWEF